MTEKTSPPAGLRRTAPVWVQVLIWVGLLAVLIVLAIGLFHAQNPILSVGSKVPNFTLTLFDKYPYQTSTQVRLSDLRGKVVVVNFWASWCVTCADEAPYVESAWQEYGPTGQVVFLGVDYTDVDAKALDYLKMYNITYPNGPDLGTRITPIFNRNIAMPETYVVDQQGVLVHQQIGAFQSLAEIQSVIDPLIRGR
ncbi:MAG TPA: TlpA disulfide reductase family protein [Anaerolineales bacterium]|nr:TlpA disulfide reductase family protein [Anaerolineales bacterium]